MSDFPYINCVRIDTSFAKPRAEAAVEGVRLNLKFQWSRTWKLCLELKVTATAVRFEGIEECTEIIVDVAVTPISSQLAQCGD